MRTRASQHFAHVGLLERDGAEAVGGRDLLGGLDGRCARIDGEHRGCPAARGREGSRAHERVPIEDPSPGGQALDALAQRPLIEIVAGLLGNRGRQRVPEPALRERNRLLEGSRAVRSVEDAIGVRHLAERLFDGRAVPHDARREPLGHEVVAEAVHDEARQSVALGVHHPVTVRLLAGEAERRAELLRPRDARLEEGCVECLARIARDHAHGDGRARRVEADAHRVLARVEHEHLVALLGGAFHTLDALRVDPRVTGPHGAHVTSLQVNDGAKHDGTPSSWRGQMNTRSKRASPERVSQVASKVRSSRALGALALLCTECRAWPRGGPRGAWR